LLQGRYGRCEDKNLLNLPGVEPRFLGRREVNKILPSLRKNVVPRCIYLIQEKCYLLGVTRAVWRRFADDSEERIAAIRRVEE
jgi:hypothetical protein